MAPTTIVLDFNQALDPTTAQDAKDYRIIDPHGHVIRIKSAVYNAANQTVTLRPSQRINVHYKYELIVNGRAPGGITNVNGQLLDGNNSGGSGSNFVAPVTWRNLVVSRPYPKGYKQVAKKAEAHEKKSTRPHPVAKIHHGAGLFGRSSAFRR